MPDRSLRRSFIALHLTLVAVALVQSGETLHHAVGDLAGHHHLAIFAALQLLAAVLFLLRRTLRIGGAVLVAVFAHAALYEAMHGAFPALPLVYAMAALFVTVHGDAWRSPGNEPGAA